MRRRLLLVPLCMLGVACGAPMRSDSTVAPSRDLLLANEIVVAQVTDVYQAIAQLRPEFFRFANGPGIAGISGVDRDRASLKVYLDEMELGSIDLLHSLPVDHVTAIRYLGPSQAALRWGPSNARGAILISTSRSVPGPTP